MVDDGAALGKSVQATGLASGPSDRPLTLGGLEVNAAQDSSNATLGLSGAWSWTSGLTAPRTDGTYQGTDWTSSFSGSVSSPLAKGAARTTLANLDGLANSTKVSLKWAFTLMPNVVFPSAEAVTNCHNATGCDFSSLT